MKKYFNVKIRIGSKSKYFTSSEKELHLELFYFGTGVVTIDNNTIEGYVANDYLLGKISFRKNWGKSIFYYYF